MRARAARPCTRGGQDLDEPRPLDPTPLPGRRVVRAQRLAAPPPAPALPHGQLVTILPRGLVQSLLKSCFISGFSHVAKANPCGAEVSMALPVTSYP